MKPRKGDNFVAKTGLIIPIIAYFRMDTRKYCASSRTGLSNLRRRLSRGHRGQSIGLFWNPFTEQGQKMPADAYLGTDSVWIFPDAELMEKKTTKVLLARGLPARIALDRGSWQLGWKCRRWGFAVLVVPWANARVS